MLQSPSVLESNDHKTLLLPQQRQINRVYRTGFYFVPLSKKKKSKQPLEPEIYCSL